MSLFDQLPVPVDIAEAHEILYTTTGPALAPGWYCECECGWISRSYRSEASAEKAHDAHQRSFIGVG